MTKPSSSIPRLPARPAICQNSSGRSARWPGNPESFGLSSCEKTTVRAGMFTPTASVSAQTREARSESDCEGSLSKRQVHTRKVSSGAARKAVRLWSKARANDARDGANAIFCGEPRLQITSPGVCACRVNGASLHQ
eukprot:1647569-Pleurochrysis_carterae.AAC.1